MERKTFWIGLDVMIYTGTLFFNRVYLGYVGMGVGVFPKQVNDFCCRLHKNYSRLKCGHDRETTKVQTEMYVQQRHSLRLPGLLTSHLNLKLKFVTVWLQQDHGSARVWPRCSNGVALWLHLGCPLSSLWPLHCQSVRFLIWVFSFRHHVLLDKWSQHISQLPFMLAWMPD